MKGQTLKGSINIQPLTLPLDFVTLITDHYIMGIMNTVQIIEGEIERIVYQSEEDSYTVARFKSKEKHEEITITGNLAGVLPGEVLHLKGTWVNHKKFGNQFQVESFVSLVPSSIKGIEKYLSSGLIKGIGPVMAKRVVQKFGITTLEVIESNPEKLSEVEGIGDKRIGMITKAWEAQKEIKQVMIFLQGHEVSASLAVKIYKQYGQNSIALLKENPYRLATDIFGIGFKTADKIAIKLGVGADSLMRAQAGVLYILNQEADRGHCFLPLPLLIKEGKDELTIREELIRESLKELDKEQKVKIENLPETDEKGEPVRAIYLISFYIAENGICRLLKRLKAVKKAMRQIDTDCALVWAEGQMGITLDPIQKKAITTALEQKVMVITGGPGTGKTTIIKAIIAIYNALKTRILLAAPTGRAAKRMQEATNYEAKTIHRLLEYSPQKGKFIRDDQNPIDADLVILDEVSMVDTILMYHLLKAIPSRASLILVGDSHQLPSVGAGNVLEDIAVSGVVEVVRLQKIFRQAQESLIVSNAHRILQGEFPIIPKKGEGADFFFIAEEEPEKALSLIIELYKVHVPNKFRFDPNKDIQVLTPMNKGVVGAFNLNHTLQKHLNPVSPEIQRGGRSYRLHDKVMQIRNNYDKEVFNGDIGRIVHLDEDALELMVEFDTRKVLYDISDLDELVLAYAISVHKSQGSEYPVILMPVTLSHYPLLQRNLIYTALTRAKKLMIMVGTKKALSIAIRNVKIEKRFTLLEERLKSPGDIQNTDPNR